jgi:hypothetical protein
MTRHGSKNKASFRLIIAKEPGLKYSRLLSRSKRYGRSTMKVKETSSTVTIEINATDLTALRASANSVLRDLQVISATELAD